MGIFYRRKLSLFWNSVNIIHDLRCIVINYHEYNPKELNALKLKSKTTLYNALHFLISKNEPLSKAVWKSYLYIYRKNLKFRIIWNKIIKTHYSFNTQMFFLVITLRMIPVVQKWFLAIL